MVGKGLRDAVAVNGEKEGGRGLAAVCGKGTRAEGAASRSPGREPAGLFREQQTGGREEVGLR